LGKKHLKYIERHNCVFLTGNMDLLEFVKTGQNKGGKKKKKKKP